MTAILNPQITGNFDYDGMTWKEYEDFKKGKKLPMLWVYIIC